MRSSWSSLWVALWQNHATMLMEVQGFVADLSVYLFGAPRVLVNGQAIQTSTRKAIALTAYLAVTAVPHTRETLATLFWPDSDRQRGRAALRTTLSVLKKAVGTEWLRVEGNIIALADGFTCDALQFQEIITSSQTLPPPEQLALLEEAIVLYQADFLAGFTLNDSLQFDEWQYTQTEFYRQTLESALQTAVSIYEQQAEFDKAISTARRWLKLDPLEEVVHQHLMRLYAASGQKAAALRQYDTLQAILQEDLGIEPTAVSTTLYQAIRTDQQPISPRQTMPNLYPGTPFIGRQNELATIKKQLAASDCRLLTVVGTGGMGKTRLALEAGRQIDPTPFTKLFFVPLASVTPGGLGIEYALANAVGFSFYGRENQKEQLLDFLKEKRWLLILDNFEHLVSQGTAFLSQLLQKAMGIKLLVTSRERLHLRGEWLITLSGLPLPETGLLETAYPREDVRVISNDAVQLFQQCAQRLLPTLDVESELDAIVSICTTLAGMPLGIELAASWVRSLSCQEITDELKTNLDFLIGSPDMPDRHRSLRAVFAHSWQLLDSDSQKIYRRLSQFNAGFSRKMAAEICNAPLPQLAALVDKSLLRHQQNSLPPRRSGGRYKIPEALQPFVLERQMAHPHDYEKMRQAQADYFAAFLQEQARALKGKGQRAALAAIMLEIENIRDVWLWMVENVRVTAVSQAIESIWLTYDMNNQFTEGVNAFQGFTKWQPNSNAATKLKSKGLARLGHFAHRLGQTEQAQQWLEEGLQLAHLCSSEQEIAFALNGCGYLYGRQGKYDQAQKTVRESVQLYRNLDDTWGLSRALNSLAIVVQSRQQTHDYLQESLAIARDIGDLWSEARLLNNLGFVVTSRPESIQLCHACVDICRQIEDRFLITFPLINLGNAARIAGRFEEAEQYYAESRAFCEEIGYQQGQARCLGHLGATAYSLGKFQKARNYCQAGLKRCQQVGDQRGIGLNQYTLGQIALAEGKVEMGITHFQKSLNTFRQSQDRLGEAWPLLGLVECALAQSQLKEAETAVQTSLHIFKEVDDKNGLTQALTLLGELYLAKQQPDEAKVYLQKAWEAGAVTFQSPPLINHLLLSIAKWNVDKQPQQAYAIAAFVKDEVYVTAVTHQNAIQLCHLWAEFEETAVCHQIKTFLHVANNKKQTTIFNFLTS